MCSKERSKSVDENDVGSNSDDAEANTNVDAGDEDEDDGTEWKTDMSAEAVARRQREQLTHAAASLVQGPAVCAPFRPSFPDTVGQICMHSAHAIDAAVAVSEAL